MTRNRTSRSRLGRLRLGLSLLEVILAIAILGGSLAVIGELVRLGTQHASEASQITTAQLMCESLLAEIASGARPFQSQQQVPLDPLDPEQAWVYSLDIQPVDGGELLAVSAAVHQNPQRYPKPAGFALVRWMRDPSADQAALEQKAANDAARAAVTQPKTSP